MSTPPKTKKPAKAPKPAKAQEGVEPGEAVPAAAKAEAPAAKSAAKTAPSSEDVALSKRLPEMTDFQLRAYQQSTTRISRDVKHAKSEAATRTLALIEQEMARRAATPGTAPSGTRAPVASPKAGKKRADD